MNDEEWAIIIALGAVAAIVIYVLGTAGNVNTLGYNWGGW